MTAVQGSVIPTLTTDTILFTPAAGRKATVDISISNQGATVAVVKLGVVDSDQVGNIVTADWYLKFNQEAYPTMPIGHDKVVIPDGYSLIIYSNLADVAFGYHGFETDE